MSHPRWSRCSAVLGTAASPSADRRIRRPPSRPPARGSSHVRKGPRMARYATNVESAAAIVATAPTGATANALFAALVAGAAAGFKLRRVTLGCIAGTGAPTSQQLSVGFVRTTARGTATTTLTPTKLDPNSAAAGVTGLDTAWSTVPTATWTPPYLYQVTFNSQSGVDLPFELMEEMVCASGTANGIAFINLDNAIPSAHKLTIAVEHEE